MVILRAECRLLSGPSILGIIHLLQSVDWGEGVCVIH